MNNRGPPPMTLQPIRLYPHPDSTESPKPKQKRNTP